MEVVEVAEAKPPRRTRAKKVAEVAEPVVLEVAEIKPARRPRTRKLPVEAVNGTSSESIAAEIPLPPLPLPEPLPEPEVAPAKRPRARRASKAS